MPGLSLEARYALVRECERRTLESPCLPGTRRLALTPCDARVLRALCFDFHNGRTGRTDPGYRAIARRAAVALGTVGAAIRRLAAAVGRAGRRRSFYFIFVESHGPPPAAFARPSSSDRDRGSTTWWSPNSGFHFHSLKT